ncbi:MAG: hypothetical protein ABH865_00450 [Candidatus Omnitrophota bacterium]|nr:hypothetical protein [Candidatus Omnitrophota bacterium]
MEYSPYAFIGAYMGIMAFMAASITMAAAAIAIAFLSANRERINPVILWILRIICWIALLIGAAYTFSSLYNVVAQLILNFKKA